MLTRPFAQVDVFSDTPYAGNALGVVLDGRGLSEAQMQRFARWTQLAETTFLLPPTPEAAAAGADYQVRIFTTAYEMPFAGHPTLGSCYAWLASGGAPQNADFVVQQSAVGLVRVRINDRSALAQGAHLAFAAPPLTRQPLAADAIALLCAALGLDPERVQAGQHLCNGPRHLGLLLKRGDTSPDLRTSPALERHEADPVPELLRLKPNAEALTQALATLGASGIGLAAPYPGGLMGREGPQGWQRREHGEDPEIADGASALIRRSNREARAFAQSASHSTSAAASDSAPDLEVRFFATGVQLTEDPVTGSFNASLAQWLIADGLSPRHYRVSQGGNVGCSGRLDIASDAEGQVWVGGRVASCIQGTVLL